MPCRGGGRGVRAYWSVDSLAAFRVTFVRFYAPSRRLRTRRDGMRNDSGPPAGRKFTGQLAGRDLPAATDVLPGPQRRAVIKALLLGDRKSTRLNSST